MDTQILHPLVHAGKVWGGLMKGAMASADTFVWKKADPPSLSMQQKIYILPVCFWLFLSFFPSARAQIE